MYHRAKECRPSKTEKGTAPPALLKCVSDCLRRRIYCEPILTCSQAANPKSIFDSFALTTQRVSRNGRVTPAQALEVLHQVSAPRVLHCNLP
jgi:hypothetical protein